MKVFVDVELVDAVRLWQLRSVYERVRVKSGPINEPFLADQTPFIRTAAVWPVLSVFWEQLSVVLALSVRGRRRFRKLKRASRLKVFLVLEAELLLLGTLSECPSAPSARSPAETKGLMMNVYEVKVFTLTRSLSSVSSLCPVCFVSLISQTAL